MLKCSVFIKGGSICLGVELNATSANWAWRGELYKQIIDEDSLTLIVERKFGKFLSNFLKSVNNINVYGVTEDGYYSGTYIVKSVTILLRCKIKMVKINKTPL